MSLAPLGDASGERTSILSSLLAERSMSLPSEMLTSVCSKPGSKSPLYLSVSASLLCISQDGRGVSEAAVRRLPPDLAGANGLCVGALLEIEGMLGVHCAQKAALALLKRGGLGQDDLQGILAEEAGGGPEMSRAEAMLEALMPTECAIDWTASRELRVPFTEDATCMYVCDGMERSEHLVQLSMSHVEVQQQRSRIAWSSIGSSSATPPLPPRAVAKVVGAQDLSGWTRPSSRPRGAWEAMMSPTTYRDAYGKDILDPAADSKFHHGVETHVRIPKPSSREGRWCVARPCQRTLPTSETRP